MVPPFHQNKLDLMLLAVPDVMTANSQDWQQSVAQFQPFVEHLLDSSREIHGNFERFGKNIVKNRLDQGSFLPQIPVTSLRHIKDVLNSSSLPAMNPNGFELLAAAKSSSADEKEAQEWYCCAVTMMGLLPCILMMLC